MTKRQATYAPHRHPPVQEQYYQPGFTRDDQPSPILARLMQISARLDAVENAVLQLIGGNESETDDTVSEIDMGGGSTRITGIGLNGEIRNQTLNAGKLYDVIKQEPTTDVLTTGGQRGKPLAVSGEGDAYTGDQAVRLYQRMEQSTNKVIRAINEKHHKAHARRVK